MTTERRLRMIAGGLILVTVVLGAWVNQWWLALTGFMGLTLFQSAFTNWCPMMPLMERLGRKSEPSIPGKARIV